MGAAERRTEIMRILCRRRHETIACLAGEFGVSERTILRDIEVLSITEPIYTQCGRYGGGVYVSEDYSLDRVYMSKEEISVLNKVLSFAEKKEKCNLSKNENTLLRKIILQYTKPENKKESIYEESRNRAI